MEEGSAPYLVDEYLSSTETLHKVPTKYDSGAVCFIASGRDHSRSLTFLVNPEGILGDATWSEDGGEASPDRSYLNLAAGNLVSAVLAMRKLSGNEKKKLPIDVAFIFLASESKKHNRWGYTASLSEAFVSRDDTISAGTDLIVVESTGLRVCNVHKGCLTFKLTVEGRIHPPSFSWLGENTLDALNMFSQILNDIVKPRHEIYPVELGKTPPLILSHFLVGYLTIAPTCARYEHQDGIGASSRIEADYYVSTPPEFSSVSLQEALNKTCTHVTRTTGCKVTIEDTLEEKPFRENPHSVIVTATSNALLKLTGFEPIFEWLPFPVSANQMKASGFARDVVAFGPGDWSLSVGQGEKSAVNEALLASEILAQVPYEIAVSKKRSE